MGAIKRWWLTPAPRPGRGVQRRGQRPSRERGAVGGPGVGLPSDAEGQFGKVSLLETRIPCPPQGDLGHGGRGRKGAAGALHG